MVAVGLSILSSDSSGDMDAQAGRRPDRQGREAPGPTLAGRGGGGWRLSVQVPFLFSGPFAVRKWSGGMAMGRKKARLNLPRIAVGSKEGAREEGVRSRCRAASVCGCRPRDGRG